MLLGIDPGKSGGLALIDEQGAYVAGIRMPILKHGKRDLVNTLDILKFLAENEGEHTKQIIIEQVNAMPGQGVTSMFNFGRHTGAVEGWALTWKLPVHWVTPQKWKKHFNLSKDKRASLDCARLRFGANPTWDVLANDGIAEAALIALYHHNTLRARDKRR